MIVIDYRCLISISFTNKKIPTQLLGFFIKKKFLSTEDGSRTHTL